MFKSVLAYHHNTCSAVCILYKSTHQLSVLDGNVGNVLLPSTVVFTKMQHLY